MKLIIGLGNPGEKYKETRHNIGFAIIEKIKEVADFSDFKEQQKFGALIAEKTKNDGEKVLLVKPLSFMNRSGEVVHNLMQFYKVAKEDILVIHDDLDITLGEFKRTDDSSAAGHNGIKSIIESLGTQKFLRFRIGIEGSERKKQRTVPGDVFVLQKFSDEEISILNIDNTDNSIIKAVIEEFDLK